MLAAELTTTTEWLVIGRQLGEGAFGVVYEAYDRRRRMRIAVKTLRSFEGTALLRLKHEFRSIVDLVHPNLVGFHELVSDGERWFLTMELVEGLNLIGHVRCGVRVRGELPRMDRLSDVFLQLVDGICALHAAGILHRDLKPSNVVVDRTGRPVVLDFGLSKPLAAGGQQSTGGLIGTPFYMAPEQIDGSVPLSAATDWYAFGVMLYEALTGDCPFGGAFADVFAAKRRSPPPGPADVISSVPREIDELCRALLDRDPALRPSAREVVGRMRALKGAPATAVVAVPPFVARPFVDRRPHLEALNAAFAAVKRGRSATVWLAGRSGMGKTALARHFLTTLREHEPDVVLLAGRCYEQESVRYKALDNVIDDVHRYLDRLPEVAAARLLPRDVLELARLFPALRQMRTLATSSLRAAEIPSAQEVRRRAAAALRELFQRIADQRPLVIFIDDLQWGDVDSGVLLNEIMRPPDPPRLLLLGCYRSEDAQRSPLLAMLRAARATWSAAGDVMDLEVGELDAEPAHELAVLLLAGQCPAASAQAAAIADESAGHPFFLNELARYVSTRGARQNADTTLDDVLRGRLAPLPDDARRLLEIIAVAGQPLPVAVAQIAAGLDIDDPAAIETLRAAHLARTRMTEIESYHDRIREAVASHLDADTLRAHHGRLAAAFEALGGADAETLAIHFRAAGDLRKAATYASIGAQHAEQALAFDRAARLHALALELGRHEPEQALALRVNVAEALANAGRGAAAGEAYLLAAYDAAASQGIEYRRRAAEQFLISGHLDRGLATLENVLHLLGMHIARTPTRAVLSFVWRRMLLALRGLRFRERRVEDLSPAQLLRIDSGWAVGIGLGMADPVRGADFQVGHLLAALRAGEPYRIVRALAIEIGYSTMRGKRSRRRAGRLGALTRRLAQRVGHPHALGLALLNAGAAANLYGHFESSRDLCERAEAVLRERCTGVTWELDTVLIFRLHSLVWMGAWKELATRVEALLKEAEDRGDLYLGTYLRARTRYLQPLAADDPAAAREAQRASLEGWTREGFLVQHYWDWFARGEIELYAGDAAVAWDAVDKRWPDYVRSHLNRFEALHIEATYLRARTALALLAAEDGSRLAMRALAREVTRGAKRIAHEHAHWGDPLAHLLRAGLAATRGDRASALRLALHAENGFCAAAIGHYAAAARRRRGELLGGTEGTSLVASADLWMHDQNVKNPVRMTAMLAPGAW